MEQGWIKLHRKLLDNPISKKPAWSWLWVVLLLKANHSDKKIIWNGKTITIKSGQFITGRKALSKESGVHESSIQRILYFLENEHQIEQQKSNKDRLITILKWESYQSLNTKLNNKRTTSEHKQELKELKEKNTADKSAEKNMKNTWKYDEKKSADSYDDSMDMETREPVIEKTGGNEKMKELIIWAEKRRGSKFINFPKQYKALSICKRNNIKISHVKERWQEMEQEEYWIKRGFDFMDVLASLDKKPIK